MHRSTKILSVTIAIHRDTEFKCSNADAWQLENGMIAVPMSHHLMFAAFPDCLALSMSAKSATSAHQYLWVLCGHLNAHYRFVMEIQIQLRSLAFFHFYNISVAQVSALSLEYMNTIMNTSGEMSAAIPLTFAIVVCTRCA